MSTQPSEHYHTHDEELRDFDFDRRVAEQDLSDKALRLLFEDHGEDRDGASVIPGTD